MSSEGHELRRDRSKSVPDSRLVRETLVRPRAERYRDLRVSWAARRRAIKGAIERPGGKGVHAKRWKAIPDPSGDFRRFGIQLK